MLKLCLPRFPGKCIAKDMNTTLQHHEDFFAAYAQSFCASAPTTKRAMLELKIEHTQYVVKHMRLLVQEEEVLKKHGRACLLAALYHDIGRFEQFSRYGTFKDAHSINHATLGAQILKQQNILAQETSQIRHYVLAAVAMHNRFALPTGLAPELAAIALAVRDADKLDILRVMAAHFALPDKGESAVTFYAKDEPLCWSEKIVHDVLQNRLASYDDIVYVNDFKILLGSWVHDITYTTSKDILIRSGYLEQILQDIPQNSLVQQAKAHVFTLLQKCKKLS